MERGLSFFKNGEDALRLERNPETGRSLPRNVRGVGFTENLWGRKARDFVKTTMRLTDDHWAEVIDQAASFITTSMVDSDNENNTNDIDTDMGPPNPRATIDLNWCAHF